MSLKKIHKKKAQDKMDIGTVLKYIETAGVEDIAIIVEVIKQRKIGLNQDFRVGQKVWFDAKIRGVFHGVIAKINKKIIY